MTTNYHTAITASAAADAATVNSPLGELDAAVDTVVVGVLGKTITAMSGNVTLTDSSTAIQEFTPDQARDVSLPAEAAGNPIFIIYNTSGSGFTITVKDDTPATVTTVVNGASKLFFSSGVVWYALD